MVLGTFFASVAVLTWFCFIITESWQELSLEKSELFRDFAKKYKCAIIAPFYPNLAHFFDESRRWREQHGFHGREDGLAEAMSIYRFAIRSGAEGRALHTALWKLSEHLQQSSKLSDHRSSWDYLVAAADEGNEEAQHRLSVAYSTGLYGDFLVPMDAGKGLLLEYMSALSGHPPAALGMGYRLLHGVGVAPSCEHALPFLEYAANLAAYNIEQQGYLVPVDLSHLTDRPDSAAEATLDLIDYYIALAEDGDAQACAMLGTLYSTGSRVVEVDEKKAVAFLYRAYRLGNLSVSGALGYLLLRRRIRFLRTQLHRNYDEMGEDTALVVSLLEQGVKKNQVAGIVGMGYALLQGPEAGLASVLTPNASLAVEHLQKALPLHADAGYLLGEALLEVVALRVEVQQAATGQRHAVADLHSIVNAFSAAAALGHVLAMHRLAHLASQGWGTARSCDIAATHFKLVAERGNSLISSLDKLQEPLERYVQLAALGYEAAQYNAAYLLDRTACAQLHALDVSAPPHSLGGGDSSAEGADLAYLARYNASRVAYLAPQAFSLAASNSPQQQCAWRSVALYALSAAQGQAAAFLQLGDVLYYGRAGLAKDAQRACAHYTQAAALKHVQAVFNLAWMHQRGEGVRQDFHLAKRYYDQAAELDARARLPRDVALWLLDAHRLLDGLQVLPRLQGVSAAVQRVDERLHVLLDALSAWLQRAWRRSMPQASGPRYRVLLRLHEAWGRLAELLDRQRELTADEVVAVLLSLLVLFVLLLFVRYAT
jgi:SEL1 protein